MELESIKTELSLIVNSLPPGKVVVKTEKDYERCREILGVIKSVKNQIESKKRPILDPLLESTKRLRELFKPFETQVDQLDAEFRNAANQYLTEKERLRQKELEAINNDKRLKNPETIQAKIHAVSQAPVGGQKRYVLKINDEKSIPREYMTPDEDKILTALKAGKKVKGAELVIEKSVRV